MYDFDLTHFSGVICDLDLNLFLTEKLANQITKHIMLHCCLIFL